MTSYSTIFGSDKGGVGKSEIATLFAQSFFNAGRQVELIEIDRSKKLSEVLRDKVSLSLSSAPTMKDMVANRYATQNLFNEVYPHWCGLPSITDLGANVSSALFEWIHMGDVRAMAIEDDVRFRFCAVVSPDAQAIRSAIDATERALAVLDGVVDVYVIFNDTVGGLGFFPFEDFRPYKHLRSLSDRRDVHVVDIPHCHAAHAQWGRARNMSPLDVWKERDKIEPSLGISDTEIAHDRASLAKWLHTFQTNLKGLYDV